MTIDLRVYGCGPPSSLYNRDYRTGKKVMSGEGNHIQSEFGFQTPTPASRSAIATIGELGEMAAVSWLASVGFCVCRADQIQHVGHSLLVKNSLREFDCVRLPLLAGLCRDLLKCRVGNYPCQQAKEDFYGFNANPVPSFDHPQTGDNRFRYYCAFKLSYLAIQGKCDTVGDIKHCFIKTYLQIDNYIHKFYDSNARNSALCGNHGGKEWFKFWAAHPGRIDLFAVKDGVRHCFEVKTNTGCLSTWQVIRMNWMKEHGFETGIVRVKLNVTDRKALIRLYNQLGREEVLKMLKPECDIEECDLSHYPESKEFVPTVGEVRKYNEMSYRWISIQWNTGAAQ